MLNISNIWTFNISIYRYIATNYVAYQLHWYVASGSDLFKTILEALATEIGSNLLHLNVKHLIKQSVCPIEIGNCVACKAFRQNWRELLFIALSQEILLFVEHKPLKERCYLISCFKIMWLLWGICKKEIKIITI